MSTAIARDVERRAAAAGRERRCDQVRAGWWVFSYNHRGGTWGHVLTAATSLDSKTGARRVQLTVTTPDQPPTRGHIDCAPSYPAFCCTPAEARRAGLGGDH